MPRTLQIFEVLVLLFADIFCMQKQTIAAIFVSTCLSLTAFASEATIEHVDSLQSSDESVVRIPERMQRRFMGRFRSADRLKFVPGGALILSFDEDEDQQVNQYELERGIDEAFNLADKNLNGYLSVFEQKEWASTLEVQDDTLANPVRFDPNLNGSISYEEFAGVISLLAKQYESEKGIIHLESLVQIKEEERKPDDEEPEKPKLGRRF